MSAYEVALVVVALALLGAVVLPRLVADKPLSFPMFYVGFGFLLFWLAPVPAIDPVAESTVTEHLTELVVIIALIGVGLNINRPFGIDSWGATWRLIAITMPLSIAVVAVGGWALLGLHPATAILLGAVLTPTDPVLASDVEAGAPLTEVEAEASEIHEWGSVRFALTSEAGFNDGLAFPFTYLAIAVAGASTAEGGGYGFLAVFVAALELRRFEWEHDYYHYLHEFAAVVERVLLATVLVHFGGAIANGLLAPLTWEAILLGFLLVVRPLAGIAGFLGSAAPWVDRLVISWFGIRGIGSFFICRMRWPNRRLPNSNCWSPPSCCGPSSASSS